MSKHNKNYVESAKSAIKQKFDRLGQLVIDKGYNASEMINTEQFNQAMTSLVDAQHQEAAGGKKQEDPA